jgi:type II secretory pathway pseudopilin PulG
MNSPVTGTRNQGVCRRRAFTLVEVVAAMALTVIIMLAVVQVFKWAVDAANETEALSDAYGMAHGIFAMLQSDLDRFSPEGYLAVRPQELDAYWGANRTVGWDAQSYSRYRFDSLMFTIVGRSRQAGPGTSGKPVMSTAAEVLYTFGLRGQTPNKGFWQGTPGNTDPRGTLLVRKEFLMPGGTTFAAGQLDPWADVLGSRSCFALMMSDTARGSVLPTSNWRLYPPAFCVRSTDPTQSRQPLIDITTADTGSTDFVMGDRVLEFAVEVWNGNKFVPYSMSVGPANDPIWGAGYPGTSSQSYGAWMGTWSGTSWTGGVWKIAGMPTTGALVTDPFKALLNEAPGSLANSQIDNARGVCLAVVNIEPHFLTPPDNSNNGPKTLLIRAPNSIPETTLVAFRDNMIWSGSSANPTLKYSVVPPLPGVTNTNPWGMQHDDDWPPATMPSMIRVTLIVSPHNDSEMLKGKPYYIGLHDYDRNPYANWDYVNDPRNRFHGVVFRQVFRLSGPARVKSLY